MHLIPTQKELKKNPAFQKVFSCPLPPPPSEPNPYSKDYHNSDCHHHQFEFLPVHELLICKIEVLICIC